MSDATRLRTIGWLALGLAAIPILQVGNSMLGFLPGISVVVYSVRYGILIGIGALTRHLGIRMATISLAGLFLVLDILSITDIFNIYDAFSPDDRFIFFQF